MKPGGTYTVPDVTSGTASEASDPYCFGRAELDLLWVRALGRRAGRLAAVPRFISRDRQYMRAWREARELAIKEEREGQTPEKAGL